MSNDPDHFEQFFAEAAQQWDLARLYRDLETADGKELKPFERACLRGLLCRYRPGQIAFKLSWTSGALRVEINKGLYRMIEAITDNAPNTLRWEKVPEWLDEAGYRLQRVPSVGDGFASGQHSLLSENLAKNLSKNPSTNLLNSSTTEPIPLVATVNPNHRSVSVD
ncbi:MAG: hypothetical protein ACK5QS_14545, partial [Pseudanabaenaceae cyanobacterium]